MESGMPAKPKRRTPPQERHAFGLTILSPSHPEVRRLQHVAPQELAAFDLIVGADICFWEELVDPLYQLVCHSVAAGVAEILVADPGRPPFDELCARCVQQGNAEVLAWSVTTPVAEPGRIL